VFLELQEQMHSGPQILILGAGFNTDNMGVAALACGTICSALNCHGSPDIALLDYGKQPLKYDFPYAGQKVVIPLINLRFSKRFFLKNNIFLLIVLSLLGRVFPRQLWNRIVAANPYLQVISHADRILAISGGDSFSDIYGLRRLFYVSLPQILVLLLRKDLILLPQTYGPFETLIGKGVARYIVSHASRCFSRDMDGIKEVGEVLGPHLVKKMTFAYDMGFALEPHAAVGSTKTKIEALKKRGPLVGLNVSGLLFSGGYNQNNMFSLKAAYPALLKSLISQLLKNDCCHIILIPHVFGNTLESDIGASSALLSLLPTSERARVHTLDEKFNQHEIKWVIGQCDFFLGSRMHACIGALSQMVPAISLAYSRKFIGVMKSLKLEELVIDLREADALEIWERTRASYADRCKIAEKLHERIPVIKRSVLHFFSELEYTALATTLVPHAAND
jgi:colanic acid/amylovoran biosynthesis protein